MTNPADPRGRIRSDAVAADWTTSMTPIPGTPRIVAMRAASVAAIWSLRLHWRFRERAGESLAQPLPLQLRVGVQQLEDSPNRLRQSQGLAGSR